GACRQSFQDIDKRTSPPVKTQEIPLRSQYWLRSLANDGLCITIIMGASFYASRRAKSIEISVNERLGFRSSYATCWPSSSSTSSLAPPSGRDTPLAEIPQSRA